MCQVKEEEFTPKTETLISTNKACVKCEKDSVIVVGTNGTFCRGCFEVYFSHKFRASMGRNPVVRHHDKVAVAYSGGNNSSALLNLIVKGLDPNAVKKLKFSPGLIFVDDSSLYADNCNEKIQEIEEIMKKTGFPYHVVKLEEVFVAEESEKDENKIPNIEKLQKLFDSITTLTSKQETLYRLRCRLLSHKAKELGYDHVFLGETCTRLAINILSNFSLGRGVHLPQDTGFKDGVRYKGFGVHLLRPMREISMKEIAIYNALNKVPTVFLPNFATNQATTSSVQNLTENFILGLVAGFPSTEMTVFRTSNKLQAPGKVSQAENDTNLKVAQNEGCILCFGSIDNTCSLENATALRHTLFSETINTNEAHVTYNNPTINIMEIPPPQDLEQTINQSVCYACRLLRKEISDPGKNLLFPTIAKTTSTYRNSNPKDIKESLRDMLLQD